MDPPPGCSRRRDLDNEAFLYGGFVMTEEEAQARDRAEGPPFGELAEEVEVILGPPTITEEDRASHASTSSLRSRAKYSTTDKRNLRHVCRCAAETAPRALYIRGTKRPSPQKRWRDRWAGVDQLMADIIALTPRQRDRSHETYFGMWAYTLACVAEKLEEQDLTLESADDPRLPLLAGSVFEYTSIPIPLPLPQDLTDNLNAFIWHQCEMRQHIAEVLGCEDIFPQEPADGDGGDPDPQVFEPEIVIEVSDLPGLPEADPAVQSPEPEAARPVPEEAIPVDPMTALVPYDPSSANVVEFNRRKRVSEEVRRHAFDVPAPVLQWLAPSLSVTEVLSGELERARADPEGYAASLAGSSKRSTTKDAASQAKPKRQRGGRRGGRCVRFAPRARRPAPVYRRARPPQDIRKRDIRPLIADVPTCKAYQSGDWNEPKDELLKTARPETRSLLTDRYYDDGPTGEDAFAEVAGYSEDEDQDPVPCDHSMFAAATRRHALANPEKYCECVKRAIAADVLRHPDDWSVPREAKKVLGACEEKGLLSEKIVAPPPFKHVKLNKQDPKARVDLKELYTVEVSNKFEPLFQEDIDVIELDQEDIDEVLKPYTHALQRAGKRALPSAAKDSRSRRKQEDRDAKFLETVPPRPNPEKSRAQRKHDGREALKRIAHRMSTGVSPRDVALTVLTGEVSKPVREMLEVMHPWLRSPNLADANGLWCWLAACHLNCVSATVTLTGLLRRLRATAGLFVSSGPTEWVRDLTVDGDVEKNPGPVNFPTSMDEIKAMLPFEDWLKDRKGLGTSMFTAALDYVCRVSRPVEISQTDANSVLACRGWWYPGTSDRRPQRMYVGTWTTRLYPSSLSELPQDASPSLLFVPKTDSRRIEAVTAQTSPASPVKSVASSVGYPSPSSSPVKRPGRGAPASAQDPGPSTSRAAPDSSGSADEEEEDDPEVILAALARLSGNVLRSTGADGPGIILPSRGDSTFPAIAPPDTELIVIGSYRTRPSEVNYARAVPITYTKQEGKEGGIFRIGGATASSSVSQTLKPLIATGGPYVTVADGFSSKIVGEWYPCEGNSVPAQRRYRSWGPPKVAFSSRAPTAAGTNVIATAVATTEASDWQKRPIIVQRADITCEGLDKLTSDKLALSPAPKATTCEALALKMGMLLDWARYGVQDAPRFNVLTGQTQVHEPRTHIVRGSPIRRIINGSGRPLEDCGGLVRPCFPFMPGCQRGKLRFYASAALVPPGERYLILPPAVEVGSTFRFAACYILPYLPWPWGNLSLALRTETEDGYATMEQLFTWYGSTTHVPGETSLNIVLHQTAPIDNTNRRLPKPSLATMPTTGGLAVELWPPYSKIPVICKPDQDLYIPAVTFAVSWAMTLDVYTISETMGRIVKDGLWDRVERWVTEGPVWFANHAGVMTTSSATLCPEKSKKAPLTWIPSLRSAEEVPIMYRCWGAEGNRMEHIPANVPWCDVELPADWTICQPNIETMSAINAGFYRFAEPIGYQVVALDQMLLSAVSFVTSERLFAGWHLLHSRMGIPVDAFTRCAERDRPNTGECDYIMGLFGGGDGAPPAPAAGTVDAILSKAVGGQLLKSVTGERMLNRREFPLVWEAQIYDRRLANPAQNTTPTPMTDVFVYKYLDTVPREFAPFMVTDQLVANRDYLEGEPRGLPPTGMFGPGIYGGKGPYDMVEFYETMDISERSFWQNRLMHSETCYALRSYKTGDMEPGAPPAGWAPVAVIRGHDDWSGNPPLLEVGSWPYPFFSTTWSGWQNFETHEVMALLCDGDPDAWQTKLTYGIEGKSAGMTFDPAKKPIPVAAGRGPGVNETLLKFIAMSGNVPRGSETGDSTTPDPRCGDLGDSGATGNKEETVDLTPKPGGEDTSKGTAQ